MNAISKPALLLIGLLLLPTFALAEIKKGDTLQTLSTLHPDPNKRLLYTLNYQLQGMTIPPCTEIKVKKISKSKMVFDWNQVEMTFKFEKHTKKAGVSFQSALSNYFGPQCDKAGLESLSEIDKEGVRFGIVKEGMTREGVMFAMGRPPVHATPDLNMPTWTYWINRFKRKLIDFDQEGKVTNIRL